LLTIAARDFYDYWAATFDEPPSSSELSELFTGIRNHISPDGSVEVSFGVIRNLELLLVGQYRITSLCDTPMASDSLRRLLASTTTSPLVPLLLPLAQRVAGTIGFIVSTTRPGAYLAYCVVSRPLSDFAFRCLLCL
jgi:hypothetical protein